MCCAMWRVSALLHALVHALVVRAADGQYACATKYLIAGTEMTKQALTTAEYYRAPEISSLRAVTMWVYTAATQDGHAWNCDESETPNPLLGALRSQPVLRPTDPAFSRLPAWTHPRAHWRVTHALSRRACRAATHRLYRWTLERRWEWRCPRRPLLEHRLGRLQPVQEFGP